MEKGATQDLRDHRDHKENLVKEVTWELKVNQELQVSLACPALTVPLVPRETLDRTDPQGRRGRWEPRELLVPQAQQGPMVCPECREFQERLVSMDFLVSRDQLVCMETKGSLGRRENREFKE